jgi:hypothetical protein
MRIQESLLSQFLAYNQFQAGPGVIDGADFDVYQA